MTLLPGKISRFELKEPSLRGHPIRIRPSFHRHLGKDFEFNLYVGFIEHLIEKLLPADILAAFGQEASSTAHRKAVQKLDEQLPLFHLSCPDEAPGLLHVSLLCRASNTHGVGRFLCDTFSRWLVPGKSLPIFCSPSLAFHFLGHEKEKFFLQQVVLEVTDAQDLELLQHNLPLLAEETKLTILGVEHARQAMSSQSLPADQKASLVQDKLESLIGRPLGEFDGTIFDQMRLFFVKALAEKRIGQVKEKISSLLKQRPDVFEADLFLEIQHFVWMFRDAFTASRSLHHLSRLIALHYLFRRSLREERALRPKERYLTCKLLKTTLQTSKEERPVLGIVVGMTLLGSHEVFEQKHALKAIQHCLKGVSYVEESYIAHRQGEEMARLFYLEVEKEDGMPFSLEEIKELKKRLPRELKASVENVAHPIFMPRNEEEVMRNILLLSQELKYVRDIPQVVISFDAQTEEGLLFNVILLRVLKSGDIPLEDHFRHATSSLEFADFDVKHVGLLRKKYVKEATLFTICMQKKPFLRKDYSLDLFKARQAVSHELSNLLGDIRDFNGGILSKQHELFGELRKSLLGMKGSSDFLLETFFYSITPPLMQSILPPTTLKQLFLMLLEALEHDFAAGRYFLKTERDPEYLLVMTSTPNEGFKERLSLAIAELGIAASDLATIPVRVYDTECLGYIFRCKDPHRSALFLTQVQEAMHAWQQAIGS